MHSYTVASAGAARPAAGSPPDGGPPAAGGVGDEMPSAFVAQTLGGRRVSNLCFVWVVASITGNYIFEIKEEKNIHGIYIYIYIFLDKDFVDRLWSPKEIPRPHSRLRRRRREEGGSPME